MTAPERYSSVFLYVEPSHIRVTDSNAVKCPVCESPLRRESRPTYTLAEKCDGCREDDRPFGVERRDRGPCECVWDYVPISWIICDACKSPKCKGCKGNLGDTDRSGLCLACRRQVGWTAWTALPIREKLKQCGVLKLKALAKRKGIKRFSQYKKSELIDLLAPVTSDKDFPILVEKK